VGTQEITCPECGQRRERAGLGAGAGFRLVGVHLDCPLLRCDGCGALLQLARGPFLRGEHVVAIREPQLRAALEAELARARARRITRSAGSERRSGA
jgi:hypothetical protein